MVNSGKLTQFMDIRDIFTENGGNFERILSMMAGSLSHSMMNSDQITQFMNVLPIFTALRQGNSSNTYDYSMRFK